MKLQIGVKALIATQDTYLFLRRSAGFKSGPQDWDIPGGRIEPEEALSDALARETKEETGLSLDAIDKLLAAQDIFVPSKELHVVRLTYLASATGDVTISDEHSEHAWMTKQQILAEEHVDSYLRKVLESLE
jgi:8-oxo-dGTP diphosphatase